MTDKDLRQRIRDLESENDFLQRRFRAVVENSLDAILLTAPDGRVFSANNAACELYRMTEEELVAQGRSAVIDPEDSRLAAAIEERARTGQFRGELNLRKKDGTLFPAEVSSAVFTDAAGTEYTSMIVRDLTGQKKTDADLRSKERLLGCLHTSMEDAVFVVTMDRTIVGMNPAAQALFEYSNEELAGRSTAVLHIDSDHFNAFGKIIRTALAHSEKAVFSFRIKTRSGKIIPTEHTVSVIRNDSGDPIGMISIVRDRSRMADLEDELTDIRFKLNIMTDTIADVFWMSTPGVGKMLYVSAAYETLWERSRQSLYQHPRSFLEAVHPDDRDALAEILDTGHRAYQSYECEYRIIRKDGEIRWIHERGFPVSEKSGRGRIMTGICTDITDHKQMADKLRSSEKRYRAVVEDQTEIIGRFGRDGTLIFVNGACCRFFGKEADALVGTKWQPLAYPEDLPGVRRRLKALTPSNPVVVIENRIWNADGDLRWMQFINRGFFTPDGDLKETQFVGRDITALKENEQLLRNREMEIQEKSDELEKINTALEVLLKHRDRQIDELREGLYKDFIRSILPDLENLKHWLKDDARKKTVSLITENMKNLLSPDPYLLASETIGLTKTEIRVAAMIRSGMTSAQIAEQLSVSPNTVGFHRKNIRKKLGLHDSGKELAHHLKPVG